MNTYEITHPDGHVFIVLADKVIDAIEILSKTVVAGLYSVKTPEGQVLEFQIEGDVIEERPFCHNVE